MRGLSIACLLALCGCATSGSDENGVTTSATDMEPAYICEDLVEWPLYIAAQPADIVVAALRQNRDLAEQFITGSPEERFPLVIQVPDAEQRSPTYVPKEIQLTGLGFDLSPGALTEVLRELNDGSRYDAESSGDDAKAIDVPEPLQGVGGLSTTLLLERLLPLEGEPLGKRVLRGRIRDYAFDEQAKRGHISVDTCIDVAGAEAPGTEQGEYIHWDIDIAQNGFVVEPRIEPVPPLPADPTAPVDPDEHSYPANPFPGISLAFPAFSLDPKDPEGRSIWQRGLDHKLHARKEVITVTDIYYRKLVGTPEETTLRRLPDTTEANTDERYINNADSCVDLLTRGQPPGTFAELAKLHELGNGYCLGRCAGTPIVNSGD